MLVAVVVTVGLTACSPTPSAPSTPTPTVPPPVTSAPTRSTSTSRTPVPLDPERDRAALAPYDFLLTDLKAAFDAKYGPLTWTTPEKTRHFRYENHQCYLIGDKHWGMKLPSDASPEDERRLIDDVLAKHGFPASHIPDGAPTPPFSLNLESIQGDSAKIVFMNQRHAAFWLELPRPDSECA